MGKCVNQFRAAFENRESIPQGPSNEPHTVYSTSESAESQNASRSLSDNSVSYEVKDIDTDEDEKKAILRHAGCAIKKAGDTVSESPDINLMIEFTDKEASLRKTIFLSIFKALGNDIKNSDDGKYYFVPNDNLMDLFQYLHVIVNDQLKLAINEAKEDAQVLYFTNCLVTTTYVNCGTMFYQTRYLIIHQNCLYYTKCAFSL